MEVYIDILLFENFIVNFFLLNITLQSLNMAAKIPKMLVSALIGALYVFVVIFPVFEILKAFPFKILIVIIMIYIPVGNKGYLFAIKSAGIYIMYSMLLAGTIFYIELQNYSMAATAKSLLIAAMIVYLIMFRLCCYLKERRSLATLIYDVEIGVKDFSSNIKAFLDTGNALKEPITNLPVIIVEKNVFKDVELGSGNKLYIPYKVVNGQFGRIEAFKPSYVKVYKDNGRFELVSAIIALHEGKLSEDDEYRALLSIAFF